MVFAEKIKKNFNWIAGILFTIIGFVFAEGWIILAVDVLGFVKSTIVVAVISIIFSWVVIYLSAKSSGNNFLKEWFSKKETEMTKHAKIALKSGKFIAVVNTAVFLGPIFASLLMLVLGIETKKVYIYAIFCAFLCASVWCGLYSGVFWGVDKIFVSKG